MKSAREECSEKELRTLDDFYALVEKTEIAFSRLQEPLITMAQAMTVSGPNPYKMFAIGTLTNQFAVIVGALKLYMSCYKQLGLLKEPKNGNDGE